MTISTSLRFLSMIRSMAKSILPALDPSDSMAHKQAKLMMGHIYTLIQQLGREQGVVGHEQLNLTALAERLLPIAERCEQTRTAVAGR